MKCTISTPVVVAPPRVVTLVMSAEEAAVLRSLCRRVGGEMKSPSRLVTKQIEACLRSESIQYNDTFFSGSLTGSSCPDMAQSYT